MKFARGDIGGISFDYGHVLAGLDLDELRSRLEAMANAFGVIAPRGTRDSLEAALPRAYVLHDEAIARGLQHEGGWRALIATLVDAGMGDRVIDGAMRDRFVDALWAAQPTRNLWRAVPPEARVLLDALSRARVPMVITSNSEGHVAELIAEVGIAHHFATILDSGVLGFGKPDRRMFDAAVDALGVDRARVVHVGDSEAADIVGAQDPGLRTIRFDGFGPGAAGRPSRADAVAVTHAELQRVLFDGIG
jgi:HAD superfamily hydrolase (TIGR01509 family)